MVESSDAARYPSHSPAPLRGKTALVTGVSRRRGIGYAIARKLATLGANIVIHHYQPSDLEQPWGGDDLHEVVAGVRSALAPYATFEDVSTDLSAPDSASRVIAAGLALTGQIDILVCNHAKSGGDGSILDMTAESLDAFWATNARSTLLLTSAFAKQFAESNGGTRPGDSVLGESVLGEPALGETASSRKPFAEPRGHVIWLTSGQAHSAMRGEVAYATSKAALAGVTRTVAAELLELGVLLNTVNPGPVNTGYMDPETSDRSLTAIQEYVENTAFGRVGLPSDAAELIGWLCTPAGSWMVGQVLTVDGGFSL